jgi:hypothetical protein
MGGIADFDPSAAWAGLVGVIDLFRHDVLGAEPARMSEHSQPIFNNVFVEQNASLDTAQQARQRRLPVQEWKFAKILAIMLDKVEGVEDRGSCCLSPSQLIESRPWCD